MPVFGRYHALILFYSNTLSFTAFCSSHQITALEFESLLQLETDNTLNAYFPPGIRRGLVTSPKNYGEVMYSLTHHYNPSVLKYLTHLNRMEFPIVINFYKSISVLRVVGW